MFNPVINIKKNFKQTKSFLLQFIFYLFSKNAFDHLLMFSFLNEALNEL